jgi:hypothetical protein
MRHPWCSICLIHSQNDHSETYPFRVHLCQQDIDRCTDSKTSTSIAVEAPTEARYPQGWYLPEAAHPYYVLAPKHHIDFASPAGPNPPIDEGSVKVGDSGNTEDVN